MSWSYQQEFLESVQDECQELIKEHWEEIALNKEHIKLNPDWEAYKSLEDKNKLKIFTARYNKKLVGYLVVVVGTNLHYKDHLFAHNDIIFVKKSHRHGKAGMALIKFAKGCLKEDGVSVFTINSKIHKSLGKLLERLKFKPIEVIYSIYLG